MHSFDLRISVRQFPLPRSRLQNFLRQALAALSFELGWSFELALSCWICGDAAMRRLNRQYRGLDRPTDVLSFPQQELYNGRFVPSRKKPPEVPLLLGDLVIDWPCAVRQAWRYGVTSAEELERLIVHGTVHLAGFDHERSVQEEAVMEKWEKRVLYRLKKEGFRLRK
ncbi:MAG: rRNA maturation RNase YbeY [Spirochaetales bacterium]|nr:rRNA maturation RNase YbeY [Spirochaetales bacterium]